jgi:hypothetical protein
MQTTYVEPITFNNAPITTGGSCRTVHRIERGIEFATNLRIVNINFACTKSDGTGAPSNLPLVAPLGIFEGISELRLETLDGTLIDSIQNLQLLSLLLNQRAPNAVLEGMGMVAGVGSYMTVNNSLNLQSMPRSYNSGLLLNASGYSIDLRKWFDFLNAVPAMNSGLNIVIVWGNSFSRAGANIVRLANTPLLAYDYIEGLYEKSVKENIQYTAYITDRLSVPVGTWMASVKVEDDKIWNDFVKTGKVKGFSLEGYFADKLETKKELSKQNKKDEIINQIKKLIYESENRK